MACLSRGWEEGVWDGGMRKEVVSSWKVEAVGVGGERGRGEGDVRAVTLSVSEGGRRR